MGKLTSLVLRKPVSTVLCIVSLIFFGIICLTLFRVELTPDISMPMYVAYCVYPGASPEDCDKLIAKKFEDKCSNLANAKKITSMSAENIAGVIVQYNYGTDMGKAYDELKKAIDKEAANFDSAIEKPIIMEMDVNSVPSIRLVVDKKGSSDLYNYVKNDFVPEIEKVSAVSQVNISGGRENYVSLKIKKEEATKYGLTMDILAQIIANADFTYPAGKLDVADRSLSVTTEVKYDSVEAFKSIPIVTGNGNTIYLEDVCDVKYDKKTAENIGRYDGDDTIIVSIIKKQSSTATELSREVQEKVDQMKRKDNTLSVTIVEDNANNIRDALKNVFETMITAIVLSMLIIFLFFGDLKASFIVGTSIPISILSALLCMYVCKFSLNMITLSALVLGVGMMVDNSIVVLEACFRAQEELMKQGRKATELLTYIRTVLIAVRKVGFSIFGGTATTCVVFVPLVFLTGIAGQFFKPLGLTIVFCMVASFISAITIVPLCYVFLHPIEKEKAPLTKMIQWVQAEYREFIPKTLSKKWLTFAIFMICCIASFFLLRDFTTELVPSPDESMIKIAITTKPSLLLEEKDKVFKEIEKYVVAQPEVEHYLLASDAGGAMSQTSNDEMTMIAYLDHEGKKGRTKELVSKWNKELASVPNCTLDITSYSTSFVSSFTLDKNTFKVVLESNSYDDLKECDRIILENVRKRKELIGAHSSLESTAPLVKIKVDPILAAAEGITPAGAGAQVYSMITGKKVMEKNIDGEKLTFQLEYPKGEYSTIEDIEHMLLINSAGKKILLKDIAVVTYADSPRVISKVDKKYRTTIKAKYAEDVVENIDHIIIEETIKPLLIPNVNIGKESYDEFLDEELTGLAYAVLAAIFLVFVVMAMQFESVKFSFMVMFTVLFSFTGSILALWITGLTLSIPALLGLMMLIGTAVNNGILYVDTVNQFIGEGMPLQKALVEAGALRYRPILMTTLTTLIAEVPMACAYGRSGEILQGLALVNFGGLITSTVTALYLLPALYLIFSGIERKSFYSNMKKVVLKAMLDEDKATQYVDTDDKDSNENK